MLFYYCELFVRQLAGFIQNAFGDSDFSDIVKERRNDQASELKLFHAYVITSYSIHYTKLYELIIKDDQMPFTEEQQNTLRKLGDQVGVAMQSVMAVEEVNSLQIGSIQALSRSIDAKSRWTAGHSERVAELSEMLGASIGMEELQLRRLVISALLHDIGKSYNFV